MDRYLFSIHDFHEILTVSGYTNGGTMLFHDPSVRIGLWLARTCTGQDILQLARHFSGHKEISVNIELGKLK